ncbi:MAG: helix-turn-helix transcriptional regulator [Patescibacteria group bacterium]|jgi:transcriptional regulator with XRE-family HTH domain
MTIKITEIQRKFGRRIQELRHKRGMTSQMALANKAGLDRTYIGGIERGERNVGLVNIQKIAKALEVSIEELFRF